MNFGLWGFRFLLWYICILLVQPQNRFTFLWPLHIADISFIAAVGLHVLACMEERRPLVRLGPGTILAMALIVSSLISLHFGLFQKTTAWNSAVDSIVKNAMLLIMIEAMAITIERVWAVQMTALFATLWWVKGGLRLSAEGATYAGDRLMSAAVSLIDNPNGFAYMMCVFLPLYLYAFQQARRKWIKWSFLACALAAVWIVFETGSRTGLVTLIALGGVLLPVYGRHHIKALAIIVTVLVLIFPMTGEKNRARFRTIPQSVAAFFGDDSGREPGPLSQDEQSAEDRQAKNRDSWALIKAYPVFGVGLNPDESEYTDRFPMAAGQVHCEFLRAGVLMGSVGIGLYFGILFVVFWGGNSAWRMARHWPAVRDLGWTLQMQALALTVGGMFSPHPWHPPAMLIAGCASALIVNLKEEQARANMAMAGQGN